MKKISTWLTHFQCTQANTTKASIAKELQTYAATSNRITIFFLQNFINSINANNLCLPTTQYLFSQFFIIKQENHFLVENELKAHKPNANVTDADIDLLFSFY